MNKIKNTTDRYSIMYRFQENNSDYEVISSSIYEDDFITWSLVKKGLAKKLLIAAPSQEKLPSQFEGQNTLFNGNAFLLCEMNHQNADALRQALPYTKAVLVGKANSFGFGDRLGNAGPAHLRSLENSGFIPILAQQSIRELDRTRRTASEVMDQATWAVFQEGYTSGYGADADHLKTEKDIDRMMAAGYTMHTIDPSDYVDNRIIGMDEKELESAFEELPWENLKDSPEDFHDRYVAKTFNLKNKITLKPSRLDILRAAVKYGRVILHTHKMFAYLKTTYSGYDTEVELSVDETPHPTTPEEHLIIAAELQRLGVDLVSLAPRFCGDFEKGIDFKGDLEEFQREYLIHQGIAQKYGGYKISLHSGSDKFSVYETIGKIPEGNVHIKTAGTSYLEALRAVAMTDASLFREIFKYSTARFETDRKTYHISAELDKLDAPDKISDNDLPALLSDDNARQILHVTFGSVLTHTENGSGSFRERIMDVLNRNEQIYEECLYKHFRKHIKPFEGVLHHQR
ncbi:MAG: tagaturonate epimerase family protein [Balneolales bacterium]